MTSEKIKSSICLILSIRVRVNINFLMTKVVDLCCLSFSFMDLSSFWFQVAMSYTVYYFMIYSSVPIRQDLYGDGNGAAIAWTCQQGWGVT